MNQASLDQVKLSIFSGLEFFGKDPSISLAQSYATDNILAIYPDGREFLVVTREEVLDNVGSIEACRRIKNLP